MTSVMVCFAVKCCIFRAPSVRTDVERQFFGALDGEEFFAIEGSHANQYSVCDHTHSTHVSSCPKTTTTTHHGWPL